MSRTRGRSTPPNGDTSTVRYLAIGAGALVAGLALGVGVGAWMASPPAPGEVPLVAASVGERQVPRNPQNPQNSRGGSIIPLREAVAATVSRPVVGPGDDWKAPAKFTPPVVTEPLDREPWRRHAVAAPDSAGRPMIAVLIDDLGLNRPNTRRTITLPAPLTLAFLTYAGDLERQTTRARAAGHELMLHVPMEPVSERKNPGPKVLAAELGPEEILRRLRWGLDRFSGYVGVNNHMGSRFTANTPGMTAVLTEIHRRGLTYVDSRTSRDSVAARIARNMGVPYAVRDIFIDNDPQIEKVALQLAATEEVARQRGYAVAIGHPHDGTLDALEIWLQDLEERGFSLVPISKIIDLTGGDPSAGPRLSRATER